MFLRSFWNPRSYRLRASTWMSSPSVVAGAEVGASVVAAIDHPVSLGDDFCVLVGAEIAGVELLRSAGLGIDGVSHVRHRVLARARQAEFLGRYLVARG